MTYWNYLKYLLRHKAYVLKAGWRLGKIPLWRLVFHDWTKFLPCEWFGYADKFFGPEELRHHPCTVAGFNYAWLHHKNHNPHHWEYWILYNNALDMPDSYIREMVADWAGAGRGITGEWGIRKWYEANQTRIKLSPTTRFLVHKYMHLLFPHEGLIVEAGLRTFGRSAKEAHDELERLRRERNSFQQMKYDTFRAIDGMKIFAEDGKFFGKTTEEWEKVREELKLFFEGILK